MTWNSLFVQLGEGPQSVVIALSLSMLAPGTLGHLQEQSCSANSEAGVDVGLLALFSGSKKL